MKTYTAVARRAGDGWEVEVIELPDITCRVDQLDDVAETVTAAIATALDAEPDTFEVEINSTVDEDVDAHVADVATTAAVAAQRHPESAARTITTAQQRLAHRLVGMGLSHRDSAYLMNVTHHRVKHLVESPTPPPEEREGKDA
jgi:hypothetical protein